MTILYLPLEPYEERYTAQSLYWTISRLEERGVAYEVIEGEQLGRGQVETGVVLDAHGRSHWALTQTARLVARLREGGLSRSDAIYIPDMFHPGFSAIPYILDQTPEEERPRIYVQCHAQTVDVYDFTHPMMGWMRPYEEMIDAYVSGIFVGSSIHRELLRVAGFRSPVHIVGLPFDMFEVQSRVRSGAPRERRILFSSRWDREKQPGFYMDLIEAAQSHPLLREYQFAVSTSAPSLRSNDPALLERARQMQEDGLLTIYEGLSKDQYYRLLQTSALHFNCALQDFISYTMLEASALEVPSLVPAYRAFPEAVGGDPRYLYTPWNIPDALRKMVSLLESGSFLAYPSLYSHHCLNRVIDIMTGARIYDHQSHGGYNGK